jgi:hypothetical protein
MADLEQFIQLQNKTMIAFDLSLATGALLAPDATLKALGHDTPSDDARELFRRCAPIWYTFAAAHAVAAARGTKADWWALSWLRGTELFTDVMWGAKSPKFSRPGSRQGMVVAGLGNAAMAAGYAWLAGKRKK